MVLAVGQVSFCVTGMVLASALSLTRSVVFGFLSGSSPGGRFRDLFGSFASSEMFGKCSVSSRAAV